MTILAGICGLLLIVIILWDGFETVILPRRVTRAFRLANLYYHFTWKIYSRTVSRVRSNNRREALIGYYGPLSLILLLIFWGTSLILGFALVELALGSQVDLPPGRVPFVGDLFLSISSFFTASSNVVPRTNLARLVTLVENGIGYGFLALIISYLPALTSAFTRREVNVSMLDERAGSPPTAFRLLAHHQLNDGPYAITQFLSDWEHWAAELMESHLSYPVLAYFRSQHDNQSWIAALTMVLDLCALIMTGVDDLPEEPARLTFAIARHAAVDLTQVFNTPPVPPQTDRLPAADLLQLRQRLAELNVQLKDGPEADRQLVTLREMYEPYINALAFHLIVSLPPWLPDTSRRDNWETTAWEQHAL